MNKYHAHIPVSQALISAFVGSLISLYLFIDFLIFLNGLIRIIMASLSLAIFISQIIITFLSILFWWNVPFRVTKEGFVTKKNKTIRKYLWEEAETLKMVGFLKIPFTYDFYLYVFVRIQYKDGSIFYFQTNSSITRDIDSLCSDEIFKAKYHKTLAGEF